ncbi:SRPBCC family protein [Labedaea rhizosphaerae]|uniref:Activator of Hsp90 ATPase-like protein n=1 Tax=Labedaea rhizosphaerae TaxID=598644 RepID=A0A4R6S488_LABRH|nr:SRPBCC family protein [Labedaea rhizosphaerae]TDP94113.1 activator of Hsp90 ATPase-like protein [Labedaea rhizosphaerae]
MTADPKAVTVRFASPHKPAAVFATLSDGWSYAGWVVGNSHIRAVDDDWPAVGSRIHHSAGAWPVQMQDSTSVLAVEPDRMLLLEAHLLRLGVAHIRLTLEPHDGGTEITMAESLVDGPARLIPYPLQRAVLIPRNRETVRRLSDLAAGR